MTDEEKLNQVVSNSKSGARFSNSGRKVKAPVRLEPTVFKRRRAPTKPSVKASLKIQCPDCKLYFTNKEFNKHILQDECRMWFETDSNNFNCSQCDKISPTKDAIRKHVARNHRKKKQNEPSDVLPHGNDTKTKKNMEPESNISDSISESVDVPELESAPSESVDISESESVSSEFSDMPQLESFATDSVKTPILKSSMAESLTIPDSEPLETESNDMPELESAVGAEKVSMPETESTEMPLLEPVTAKSVKKTVNSKCDGSNDIESQGSGRDTPKVPKNRKKNIDTESPTVICPVCKLCYTLEEIEKHNASNECRYWYQINKKEFQCSLCKKISPTKDAIRKHVSRNHKKKKADSQQADENFKDKIQTQVNDIEATEDQNVDLDMISVDNFVECNISDDVKEEIFNDDLEEVQTYFASSDSTTDGATDPLAQTLSTSSQNFTEGTTVPSSTMDVTIADTYSLAPSVSMANPAFRGTTAPLANLSDTNRATAYLVPSFSTANQGNATRRILLMSQETIRSLLASGAIRRVQQPIPLTPYATSKISTQTGQTREISTQSGQTIEISRQGGQVSEYSGQTQEISIHGGQISKQACQTDEISRQGGQISKQTGRTIEISKQGGQISKQTGQTREVITQGGQTIDNSMHGGQVSTQIGQTGEILTHGGQVTKQSVEISTQTGQTGEIPTHGGQVTKQFSEISKQTGETGKIPTHGGQVLKQSDEISKQTGQTGELSKQGGQVSKQMGQISKKPVITSISEHHSESRSENVSEFHSESVIQSEIPESAKQSESEHPILSEQSKRSAESEFQNASESKSNKKSRMEPENVSESILDSPNCTKQSESSALPTMSSNEISCSSSGRRVKTPSRLQQDTIARRRRGKGKGPGSGKVACSGCGLYFSNLDYKQHIISNECRLWYQLNKKGFQCSLCKKISPTKDAIRKHVKRNHKKDGKNKKVNPSQTDVEMDKNRDETSSGATFVECDQVLIEDSEVKQEIVEEVEIMDVYNNIDDPLNIL